MTLRDALVALEKTLEDWSDDMKDGAYAALSERIEAMRAALDAAWPGMVARIRDLERIEAGVRWRPIDCLPNTGEVVMFYVGEGNLPILSRCDDFHTGFAHWLDDATHWMPLPAAPADGEK